MNTQPQVEAEVATQPELTIADLQNISAIIDAAVRRGAAARAAHRSRETARSARGSEFPLLHFYNFFPTSS